MPKPFESADEIRERLTSGEYIGGNRGSLLLARAMPLLLDKLDRICHLMERRAQSSRAPTDTSLEPDCYVKISDGGGVRWVACERLGTRAVEDEEGEFDHVEVLVRPVEALTMAWVHGNLCASEPPAGATPTSEVEDG